MIEPNYIGVGDCLELIPEIKDRSVDLVITSPPYNVNLGDNKYNKSPYDLYNDNKEHHKFIEDIGKVTQVFTDKLKIGSRVVINIGDGKNGSVPTSSDIIQVMVKQGYIPMTHIIWDKSQVGNRTSWGSWLSPSCPSFPTPFEHILVFGYKDKKIQYKGETDLERDEFIEWSLALWRFAPENKMKSFGHPAMFPEELPKRLIKMLSYKDAVVVDPFNGAGTTTLVSHKLGRRYIGFDLSSEYCSIAQNRIFDYQKNIS